MTAPPPLVSVLITTYNRSNVLRRAINSVLMQDFRDFEIIVVDDCSSDDTMKVVTSFADPRIRYIRNETNVGSKLGDRAILRQFIYELMTGKYWVYLCDDDYWLYPDLLSRQIEAFNTYDNVVMVIGGQLSHFLTTPDSYLGPSTTQALTLTLENIGQFFDMETLTPKTPHLHFMRASTPEKRLFPKVCMIAEEFLEDFAGDPTTKNIIGGAMLYSREHFIKSEALRTVHGSQWQAGYELKLGPACFGNTVYFDEPSIVAEVRATNASFRRTQLDHYFDSVISVELAFDAPMRNPELVQKRTFLKRMRDETIRNLSRVYLINGLAGFRQGGFSLCSEENLATPVRLRDVAPVLWRNRILPSASLTTCIVRTELGWLNGGAPLLPLPLYRFLSKFRHGIPTILRRARRAPNKVKRVSLNIFRAMWHSLSTTIRNIIYPR